MVQELGGAQELGRRRPPLGGGGRAAATRPPPAVAAPPNQPTLSETGHVDRPGRCPRRRIDLKLGMHKDLVIGHRPRAKKGPSQGSTGSHCRFCPTLVPSLPNSCAVGAHTDRRTPAPATAQHASWAGSFPTWRCPLLPLLLQADGLGPRLCPRSPTHLCFFCYRPSRPAFPLPGPSGWCGGQRRRLLSLAS